MPSDTTLLNDPMDTLWYRQPAVRWAEALPIGNGRIGAMVFGGIKEETILLSEGTCWSGERSETNNRPGAADLIPAIRRSLFDGDDAAAHEVCEQIIGEKQNYGTNLPAGRLFLDFRDEVTEPPRVEPHGVEPHSVEPHSVTDYRRQLNLDRAKTSTSVRYGQTNFDRSCFVSHPHQVLVLRVTTDNSAGISFGVSLDGGANPSSLSLDATDDLLLVGHAYESIHSDGRTGVSYAIRLRCLVEDGTVETDTTSLQIKQSSAMTLLVAISTTYVDPNPEERTRSQLDVASGFTYQELESAHILDHRALYDRCRLDLGQPPPAHLPTDERLKLVQDGTLDPALDALMFHYGRYLLLASSREDSPLPAHLQGAWNDNVACRIGWTCDMHLDINTQMNYWPSEVTNLSECNGPLFDWVEQTLVLSGQRTARETYGIDGWVAHVVSNAWGFSAPGWSTRWGLHPSGGAWIAMHFWDHFRFTGDIEFLRARAYPLLKEAATFFMAYLTADPESGHLLSGPSCSPENVFAVDGKEYSNSMGPTCDTVIIRALLEACMDGGQIVDEDEDILSQMATVLSKLPPFEIGAYGQLQEWNIDYPEPDLHHRHTAHLLALFPFGQICPEQTPELATAAQVSIDRRTLPAEAWEDTGWARSLLILYAARLRDGEAAADHILAMQRTLTDTNLLVFHPAVASAPSDVYELDGNTGLCAGIAEMLLQSHEGILHLLPALPPGWSTGSVTGLCARGGFTVDMAWQDGVVVEATVVSVTGGCCRVRYQDSLVEVELPPGEAVRVDFGPV